jgi:dehydrogenase/reductase SDR family protein 12
MTRLVAVAHTSLDQATTFAAVAEFANIEEWDPGVVRSVKEPSGPTDVGTSYELELEYGRQRLNMTYTVTEYQPHERVVLHGYGDRIEAVDTVTFEADGAGTVVTYEAELRLTGLARLAQPLLRTRFAAIGRAAGDGLRSWLSRLEAAAAG